MNHHEHDPSGEHDPANPLAPLLEVEPDAAALERALRRAKGAIERAELPNETLPFQESAPSRRQSSRDRSSRFPAVLWRLAAGLAASIAFLALWFVWPRSSVAHELAAMQARAAGVRDRRVPVDAQRIVGLEVLGRDVLEQRPPRVAVHAVADRPAGDAAVEDLHRVEELA